MLNLESWSFIGTVVGGGAAMISIAVAIWSAHWTNKFSKKQAELDENQAVLAEKAQQSDTHTKQTNDYETAISLYEKATDKTIYEEMRRLRATTDFDSPDAEDLSSTFTKLRLEEEALLMQKVLCVVPDSYPAENIETDDSLKNSNKVQRAISEEIRKTLTKIAERIPEKLMSQAEENLSKYFPEKVSNHNSKNRETPILTTDSPDIFSTHAKVLELFGFKYKQWLKGWKTLNSEYAVWFPHLDDANEDWKNDLSENGRLLSEEKRVGEFSREEQEQHEASSNSITRFAFAFGKWGKDDSGKDKWGYKFVGAFEPDRNNVKNDSKCRIFKRIPDGADATELFFDGSKRFDIKPITSKSPTITASR